MNLAVPDPLGSHSDEVDAFFAANPDIETIHMLVPDTNGIMRGKWGPPDLARKAFADGVQLPLSIFGLGLTFALITFLVKAPVGLVAGLLSGWLRARPGVLRAINRVTGMMLIGLGLKLAFERRD